MASQDWSGRLLASRVAAVAAANLQACALFDRLGLRFGEVGGKPIGEACLAHDIDLAWVAGELEQVRLLPQEFEGRDGWWWDADDVSRCIVRTHHAPLRASVGNVSERLHAVAEPPGGVDGPLRSVSERFSDLAAVLLAHFDKEENILFPALTLLAESRRHGTPRPSLPFPSVLYPIRVMESEHDRVDGDLARMGVMAGEAPVTPANDRAWADCRAALDRFAGELTAHAHFENGWLFPRALDLEQSLV